jgi:hypothetical protein
MAWFASYMAERFMGSLRRVICALRGHESYLHFEKNRVYLQCIGCGHESPGWTIDVPRPVLRFQSKRERTSVHAVIRKIA